MKMMIIYINESVMVIRTFYNIKLIIDVHHMKTSKAYSKSIRSESQDIDDPQLAKMNLFFIKSKHAFRHYKNHDYF